MDMRADRGESRVTDGSVAHRLEAMVREAFGPAHAFRALSPDQHRDEPVVLVGGALPRLLSPPRSTVVCLRMPPDAL